MLTISLDSLPVPVRDSLLQARGGEMVVIVDHGRTVAHLVPEPNVPVALSEAAVEGGITLPAPGARRSSSSDFPPITGGGIPASRMVIEDRQ